MSLEREEALLDAALEELSAVGYDRLTIAAVCERAGASTKTAYRRWGNKEEMLTAALRRAVDREISTAPALVRRNSLRESLVANLEMQAHSYRASANLVIGLIVASRIDGDLGTIAREVIWRYEAEHLAALLHEAAADGQARADVEPGFVADLARSFFLHELLVRDQAPTRRRITEFVDRVLIPVCTTAPVA
jgi:AcrR family transcriptional regulator